MEGSAWIVDVGDDDFERQVLERSQETPVVVDFWAPWCGPCRALGPLLERLAEQHAGAFVLARVDVDTAPVSAQRYGIRGIPAVLGFRQGELVSESTGAQPEPAVRRFLEALLPSRVDLLVQEAAGLAGSDAAAAEARYRQALEESPRHPRALLGLAQLLAASDGRDEALALLERIVPGSPAEAEVQRLAAQLRTRGEDGADLDELEARVAADPEDPGARLALGRALAARGHHEEALVALLEAVRRDPGYDDDAARRAMLDVFAILGPEDPLTSHFRSELARALYR